MRPACSGSWQRRFRWRSTLLEHAEWLVAERRGEEAEAALAEARDIFTGLRAAPWLERLERVREGATVTH